MIKKQGLRMRILVTDDSKMARRMLIKTLKELISEEYIIDEASNGQECVELFSQHQHELTFLDLTMPVMDGFEALKQIKAIKNDANVVIVSADIQKGSMDRVREDGALDFVKKPIDATKMQQIFDKVS